MRTDLWTAEDDAALRQAWEVENLSASACAKRVGKSRNACIGRARRLALTPRGSPILAPFGRLRGVKPLPIRLKPIQALPAAGECLYATTDTRPYAWCCAPVRPGSPYCDAHHAACYTRAAPMQVPTPTRTGNPRHFGSEGKFINPRSAA